MYFTYFEGVSGNLLHERESQIVPPGRIQLRTPQKRDHCREAYCPGYIPWCGLGTRSMLYTQAKQLASRGGWLAMKRGQLSNEQLAEQLRWYGETPGPITGTTRGVYQQKLAKLLRQNTQFSPNRRLKSDPLPSGTLSVSRSSVLVFLLLATVMISVTLWSSFLGFLLLVVLFIIMVVLASLFWYHYT